MNKLYMYEYRIGTESGEALAKSLGIKRIKHAGSIFVGHPDTVIINWGSSSLPDNIAPSRVLNKPETVATAINKKKFFRKVGPFCRVVPYTTDQEVAKEWLSEGYKVVCRKQVKGYEGQGIEVICPQEGQGSPPTGILGTLASLVAKKFSAAVPPSEAVLPTCPLYTQFIRAKAEYRVHVVGDKVIAVHKKVGDGDPTIKNTANNWKFKRVQIYNQDVVEQALLAVKAVELDFAAVDVLWDGDKAWVLEANTAPGIYDMPWTLEQWTVAIRALALPPT